MVALRIQIKFKFSKTEKKFIPLPATWINAKKWEDEVDEGQSAGQAQQDQSTRQTDTSQLPAYLVFGSKDTSVLQELAKVNPEITEKYVRSVARKRGIDVEHVLRDLKDEMERAA